MPPFFELCEQHRDWDGMPCYLLKLPVEIRMEIFRYLVPDRPISAWLDYSLRTDQERCAFNLLLVNKQISQETSDLLYGSQPFTVSIQRNSLSMCGRVYYHDRTSPLFNRRHVPPPVHSQPPMINKVRSLRVQMTLVKPSSGPRRHRVRRSWDEETEIYDLRDSVQSLVHMLRESSSLRSLSVVLVTQNLTISPWTDSDQIQNLKIVVEPFQYLRSLSKVKLDYLYKVHSPLRMNTTQYILDNLRKAEDQMLSNNEFTLYNDYGPMTPEGLPGMPVSKVMATDDDFLQFKSRWESTLQLRGPHVIPETAAHDVFADFRKAYEVIEGYYPSRLPKGKDMLLHRARVCREKNDVSGIFKLRTEMQDLVSELIKEDRDGISEKENVVKDAFGEFDTETAKDPGSNTDPPDAEQNPLPEVASNATASDISSSSI